MYHRPHSIALAAILAVAPLTVCAQDAQDSGLSWNVNAVSEYLFRSVSRTDEKPTLQGGISWMSPIGVYAGSWASGLDEGPGRPHLEVDYFVGYQARIDPALNIDAALKRYTHPGASHLAWNELTTTTTLYDSWQVLLNYSPRVLASGSRGWYYGFGKNWSLPFDLSLSAKAGRSMIRDHAVAGIRNFTDWNVGVSRAFGPLDVSLGYYGTDRNGRRNFSELANNRVFLSVGISGP